MAPSSRLAWLLTTDAMPNRNTVASSSVAGRGLIQGREENGQAKRVVSITVASDLNNLLLAIIEYADLALVGLPKASQRQADIERIRTAAQLAVELIPKSGTYSDGNAEFTDCREH